MYFQLSDKEIAKRAKAVDMYMVWAWLQKFVLHRIKERVQEIPREKWYAWVLTNCSQLFEFGSQNHLIHVKQEWCVHTVSTDTLAAVVEQYVWRGALRAQLQVSSWWANKA